MNSKVMGLLYYSAIVCIIFTVLAVATFSFGVIYVVVNNDWESVLSLVYSFFHLLICFVSSYLAIKAIKAKKSIIMRTIMYVNDYKELDPSTVSKVFAIVLGVIGLFAGTYFGLSYILSGVINLFGFNWPMMFRLVMVNVGFYIFLLAIAFFIFPYVYNIQVDIEEMKAKKNKKHQEQQLEMIENSEENKGEKDEN